MIQGSVVGLFATTVGGVPKPSVESIEVETLGIKDEIIRDKKHHGGADKAVCLLSQEILQRLTKRWSSNCRRGSTGENILIDVPFESLQPGVQLQFHEVELEITWQHHHAKPLESFMIRTSTNYRTKSIQEEHVGTPVFLSREHSSR